MKRKTSYTRGPYKKQKEIITAEEDIENMIIELRDFKDRIKRIFNLSYYRSRIIENLQREIDCLEKVRKKQEARNDEIQKLKFRIEQLENESFVFDIETLLKDVSSDEEKESAFEPTREVVSELGNEPEHDISISQHA